MPILLWKFGYMKGNVSFVLLGFELYLCDGKSILFTLLFVSVLCASASQLYNSHSVCNRTGCCNETPPGPTVLLPFCCLFGRANSFVAGLSRLRSLSCTGFIFLVMLSVSHFDVHCCNVFITFIVRFVLLYTVQLLNVIGLYPWTHNSHKTTRY